MRRPQIAVSSGPSVRAIAVAVAYLGCGPSFEAIQEGDLRFAHCDRLDLDANISSSHRLHCWREWRRMYTYGQTRDRVEYAQRRIAEVSSGDTEPPFDLPDGTPRLPPTAAPAPGRSSPPAIVPQAVRAPASSDPRAGVDPECRSRCEAGQRQCAPGCDTQPKGCEACATTLQACLDNCTTAPP